MKFCLVSDLHIDLNQWDWKTLDDAACDTDTLVVAGDISNDIWEVSHWLQQARERFENVLWVAGNHDFYNLGFHQTRLHDPVLAQSWPYPSDMAGMIKHYSRWCEAHGVHFLHRKSVLINGVIFVGATGWHDYRAGEPYTTDAQIQTWYNCLNDTRIVWQNGMIKPNHLAPFDAGMRDWEYISEESSRLSNDAVVITHHVPHRLCLWHRPHDNVWTMLHGSFANTRMESIVNDKIRYWIYGHTHQRGMRTIGTTNYVCNARGYRGENERWEPLMLEV